MMTSDSSNSSTSGAQTTTTATTAAAATAGTGSFPPQTPLEPGRYVVVQIWMTVPTGSVIDEQLLYDAVADAAARAGLSVSDFTLLDAKPGDRYGSSFRWRF